MEATAMQFTVEIAIFVFIVQFVSYMIKGLAGFGDPLISNPMMSMVMASKDVAPMNLLLNTPMNLYMSWINRKSFSIRATLPMVAAVLVGMVPGIVLLKYATSWIIKAILGVVVIGIGVEMYTRSKSKQTGGSRIAMAIASFFSGMTAGLYGINLFFVAYVERTSLSRSEFRGNICFVFLIENVCRLIGYIALGLYSMAIFKYVLVSVPAAALGMFTGQRVDKHLNDVVVKKFVIVLFILSGLSILVKALIWRM